MFWGASEELFGATDTVNDIDEQITKARKRLAAVRDDPTQNALLIEEDVTALEHAKKHL
jgi:predicted  nucleic acid-binding Zn-ribbon protein